VLAILVERHGTLGKGGLPWVPSSLGNSKGAGAMGKRLGGEKWKISEIWGIEQDELEEKRG